MASGGNEAAIAPIVGAAVGGSLAIVAIVVVIQYCWVFWGCCRRRPSPRIAPRGALRGNRVAPKEHEPRASERFVPGRSVTIPEAPEPSRESACNGEAEPDATAPTQAAPESCAECETQPAAGAPYSQPGPPAAARSTSSRSVGQRGLQPHRDPPGLSPGVSRSSEGQLPLGYSSDPARASKLARDYERADAQGA
jgi:hypothetical protein